MKKLFALLLVVAMVLSMTACVKPNPNTTTPGTNPSTAPSNPSGPSIEIWEDDFVYYGYSSSLGTNWNPHTWETNADDSMASYMSSPLATMTVLNSEEGTYQWVFVMAENIIDVTEANQADLEKYGCTLPEGKTAADIKDGYVYEIKLREGAVWQDGTVINADTYVYSMQQLLSSSMKNYRAGNYVSGESAIAGAEAYFNSGSPVYNQLITYVDDAPVANADFTEKLNAGELYINVNATNMTLTSYALTTLIKTYNPSESGKAALAVFADAANVYGYSKVTAENLADLYTLVGEALAPFGYNWETDFSAEEKDDLVAEACFYFAGKGEEVSWDSVGFYKVDDYTFRYVCQTSYDYYYFLTSMTSNWIVHEATYEAGKDTSGELVTTNYGTTKDTSVSYGPYKMDSIQDEKQVVFVRNETYWEYEKTESGYLYAVTDHLVDGEHVQQYMTTKYIIDVMTDDEAKQAFLKGQITEWTPAADDVVNYATSEQLYQVDETYTQRLFFNCDLENLKVMDESKGNTNSVVLSNWNFRKAFSLAIDRAEFVTATAGYKPACFILNSLYHYDIYNDPASSYRATAEAKQAICDLYGIKYGAGTPYADLDEAYNSVTGLNLTEAKNLMKVAHDELVAAGLYTSGDPIVIRMGWKKGANDSTDQSQIALLNKYINAAAKDAGFGEIKLVGVDNITDRYGDTAKGEYAIGWGAWGGAAFYPFTIMRVYCDADYAGTIHEGGSWDPAIEELTLTVNGEEVTMTWYEWSNCMAGTGKYADSDFATKLAILSSLERELINKLYFIPMCTTTACFLLSYQVSYYTEDYHIMYGFGGSELMRYNYSDSQWKAYVAEQGGTLTY